MCCQSCVRSRCGRLLLGMEATSRKGLGASSVHYLACPDKRSGPPDSSANMCEESSGQVCYYVSAKLVGQYVSVQLDAKARCVYVYLEQQRLKSLQERTYRLSVLISSNSRARNAI